MVARAADEFRELPAIRDDQVSLSYSELAARADRFGAALVESGLEPGDRVATGASTAPTGWWRSSASSRPAASWFRSTRGSRDREAAELLARSRARVLVTVTDFLGTDYVSLLEGAGTPLPDLATTVIVRGAGSGRSTLSWGDFVDGADAESWMKWHAGAPRSTPTTRRTSSSPRAPPECPKAS